MVQSELLKWTERTLKRIKSFLVLFLKYGRKIHLVEQHAEKRDEVHFLVNLYGYLRSSW